MTTLFVSVVAVVLFTIISLLMLTYVDANSAKAVANAPGVVTAISNMVEAVSIYRDQVGSAPASTAQLSTVVDVPALPVIDGAAWTVTGGFVCLSLPTNETNVDLLNAARFRFGSVAVINSGFCNDGPTVAGTTVLSVAAG